MGRGNACVHGDYEGLYYIDYDNFPKEYEDEYGNVIEDYDFQREEVNCFLDELKIDLKKRFKSFSDTDEWIDSDEYAILENSLFYIVTEDNEWSVAIKLIQKEQDFYSRGNIENLQAGLYKKYLEGLKECLFNHFDEIGVYAGPWTSGTIKKCA